MAMPPLLQFWIPIALAAAMTALAMHEKARVVIQTGLYILAAVIATAAITWEVAHRVTQSSTVHTVEGPIILGWGSDGPFCAGVLDGSRLFNFRDKYAVALACALEDETLDKYENTKITVSLPFTIHSGPIPITVAHRPAMAEEIKKRSEQAWKQLRLPKGTPGVNIGRTWYEVILLPKGTDTADIRKLSDVRRHGGKVLSQEPS